jgi:hypothetical protein
MRAETFTKIYKKILVAGISLIFIFSVSDCQKDKVNTADLLTKYLYFCPAGNSTACKASCVEQFDKDKDGAVEDQYTSSYTACTSACSTYCEATLLILLQQK